jgi:hypothetical protein
VGLDYVGSGVGISCHGSGSGKLDMDASLSHE